MTLQSHRRRRWGFGFSALLTLVCRDLQFEKLHEVSRANGAGALGGSHAAFLGPSRARRDRVTQARVSTSATTALSPLPQSQLAVGLAENKFWTWLPVILVAVAAVVGPALPQIVQHSAAAAMITILGVPHGAVDHISYEEHAEEGKANTGLFVALYLVAMAAGAAFIYLQPVVGVASFLAASSYHWGLSHGSSWSPRLIFLGGAIIQQLQAWHPDEVGTFSRMLAPAQADQVAGAFDAVGLISWAGFGAFALAELLRHDRGANWRGNIVKEIVLLASVAYLSANSSLLWSFAVYFSLGHSIEGWREQFTRRQSITDKFSEYYCMALPCSLVFMVGCGLIVWLSAQNVLSPGVALAALLAGPVPHVVLQEWAFPHQSNDMHAPEP